MVNNRFSMIRKPPSTAILRPEQLRETLAHPEWFHVTGKGDAAVINVNLLRMPAPARTMVATVSAVALEGKSVNMVFGQRWPGADRMTGALLVSIPARQVRQVLYGSPEFLEKLRIFARQQKIEPEDRVPDPSTYPSDRTVTERAAFVAIAFAEEEAEMRFFRLSPTDLRAVQQGESAELVHPVVEVVLATEELVHFLLFLSKLVPEDAP